MTATRPPKVVSSCLWKNQQRSKCCWLQSIETNVSEKQWFWQTMLRANNYYITGKCSLLQHSFPDLKTAGHLSNLRTRASTNVLPKTNKQNLCRCMFVLKVFGFELGSRKFDSSFTWETSLEKHRCLPKNKPSHLDWNTQQKSQRFVSDPNSNVYFLGETNKCQYTIACFSLLGGNKK